MKNFRLGVLITLGLSNALQTIKEYHYFNTVRRMEELNVIKQAIEIAVKAGVYQMADVVALSQILDKLETKLKENADD
jgi:hypothetical protein